MKEMSKFSWRMKKSNIPQAEKKGAKVEAWNSMAMKETTNRILTKVSSSIHWVVIHRLVGKVVGMNCNLEGLYDMLKNLNSVSLKII